MENNSSNGGKTSFVVFTANTENQQRTRRLAHLPVKTIISHARLHDVRACMRKRDTF